MAKRWIGCLLAVTRRELGGYFATPLAYVFIVIFLVTAGAFTFHLGGFLERGQADLSAAFFTFHPWLYLFLMPALAMRLWAEERKTGTIELLLTMPIPLGAAVVGKFLAAWIFTALALMLTFPIWLTVNYLGQPDNAVILAGYLGSLFMAGGYLAIGACVSALTKNQVIAFVVGSALCFVFTVSGSPLVLGLFAGWAPQAVLDVIASFSFLTHFASITKGVIALRDVVYFGSLIGLFLFANAVAVELKKGQ
ncbi:MAG: ABC transporter permease [Kiloniellales bacterium]